MKNIKTNSSGVMPYVIVGSAIGGAIGYFFLSESGRKVRRVLTNPDELASRVDRAGVAIEHKMMTVTRGIHDVIDSAKQSIEEGRLTYREVGQQYRSQIRDIQNKNYDIAAGIHEVVDSMSRKAGDLEQQVLEPVAEVGALFRGVKRGIEALLNKTGKRTVHPGPTPIYGGPRVMES